MFPVLGRSRLLQQGQQSRQQLQGSWRATVYMQIHRHDVRNAGQAGIAICEKSAIGRAVSHCNHPLGIRCCIISTRQRLGHIFCYRSGDQ